MEDGREPRAHDERVAVVTRATGSIGASVSEAMVRRRIRTTMLDRSEQPLCGLRSRLGSPTITSIRRTDVTDPFDLVEAREAVLETFDPPDLVVCGVGVLSSAPFEEAVPAEFLTGAAAEDPELDTLILSAGEATFGPFLEHDAAFWTRNFTNNATATIAVARALLPTLVSTAGRTGAPADVVFIGAVSSRIHFAGALVYSAAAAAMDTFCDQLHTECSGTGVRVRNVRTGYVLSPMSSSFDAYGPLGEDFSTFRDDALRPADVAEVVLYTIDQPPGVHVQDISLVSTGQGWA